MTNKYQRPAGAFAGVNGLANRTKYQDDSGATPKRAVSSAKVDGDLNYVIDALNQIDEASGVRASINERLDVSLNADGTLKLSTTGTLDEWIVHVNPGTVTRVDNSTIGITGDWRAVYTVNRRVKLVVSGLALVGDVAEVSYASGVTTVSLIDLLDGDGYLQVIGSAPTQIAYGPFTGGPRGNAPRRFDGIRIPSGASTYELRGDGTNLVFKHDGVPVSVMTENGLAGFAPTSVGAAALSDEVYDMLVPTGAVMPFAGSAAPTGWLMCAGQPVSRSDYANLYVRLGTAYGAGNGTTTFNLPDMRGRSVFGMDNMGGTDAGRLSVANTLGGSGGAQTKSGSTASYTLTVADIPAHTHDGNVTHGGGTSGTGTGLYYNPADTGNRVIGKSTGGGGGHSHGITNFDVMPPFVLMNYIIKT
ncbi:MAG: tail fiber protein [Alphaproteobacteria bacterium]|nr:MAG: tail fiber protein [Alphaproteobacteria bacterium]